MGKLWLWVMGLGGVSNVVAFAIFITMLLGSSPLLFNAIAIYSSNNELQAWEAHDSSIKLKEGGQASWFKILDWELFKKEIQGRVQYRYYYVTSFQIGFINGGGSPYVLQKARELDLFVAFSKNVGTDNDPELGRSATYVPYVDPCGSAEAPCWEVSSVSAVLEPSGLTADEILDVMSPQGMGSWNPGEELVIGVKFPTEAGFTLVQVIREGSVVGGIGWLYAHFCSPRGVCFRPANLLDQPWRRGVLIKIAD